ncbi:MAG: Fe-S protein assembly co-chaperone HscB [Rhodocyclaceae bacterium]|nr:Fe-S protein assembly co-chaperone HscB [Rhodocyclaceae bacterium]
MSIDLHKDYFALFELPRSYRIDREALERRYLQLQQQVHPDRHAHLPDAERRRALQWATRVNEGFQTLRRSLARARYLLDLAGVDAALETNTAMSPEFLMEQMEWREAVSEAHQAGDVDELEHLHRRLRSAARTVEDELAVLFDDRPDLDAAAETVRRLMFLEKLDQEIDEALAALES